MTAPHPNCRIGKVTLKADGFRIVRLEDQRSVVRRAILTEVRYLLDGMQDDGEQLAGFAVVAWDTKLNSGAINRAYTNSPIPGILVPDFVRNRLLAKKIEDWANS